MKYSNRLYWKISLTLLALIFLLGVSYVMITGYIGNQYLMEVNQKLYGSLADSTLTQVSPIENGQIDTVAIQDIMHSTMVMNPSVEVYLLDTKGKILTHVAPNKRVKRERVALEPILEFINSKERPFIMGQDPRHLDYDKVFSAAPIIFNGQLEGYLYMILASEEQDAVTTALSGSYMLQLGTNMFLITLGLTLILGLLAIWYLTKNLRHIIDTVKRFKEGDYAARISEQQKGDLTPLADTFNDMADQIVANIDQLKSVERLRQELIANVSHDLRTPLAIMQGYVETMIMKDDQLEPEARKRYLNTVLSSSEKLSKLVAQLFEYSKLEANQIEPQKEPFFLSDLAQDVMAKYQILAERQNVRLSLDASRDLPLVFADVALVERVIQNLMDNALKFTPSGGEVRLILSANNKEVEVRIADTGPGIPEHEQAHIFERYRQVGPGEVKSKGAGLGLAIVKKILDIHNSTIRVQSQPDRGAAFWFQLPVYEGAV